jgi:hypothetical protein
VKHTRAGAQGAHSEGHEFFNQRDTSEERAAVPVGARRSSHSVRAAAAGARLSGQGMGGNRHLEDKEGGEGRPEDVEQLSQLWAGRVTAEGVQGAGRSAGRDAGGAREGRCCWYCCPP